MEYHDKDFYICQCHTHALNVERGIDIMDKEKKVYDVSIYFSMWHYGTDNNKPTLKEKLRHCWQILKTGKNFRDDVILTIEDAQKLSNYLKNLCNEEDIKIEIEKMISENKSVS